LGGKLWWFHTWGVFAAILTSQIIARRSKISIYVVPQLLELREWLEVPAIAVIK